MTARTVLNTTLTDETSYSSGPLSAGDLVELAVDMALTTSSGPYTYGVVVSRVMADGSTLNQIGTITNDSDTTAVSIGAGLSTNESFGSQIQVDLYNPNGYTISGVISVIGK